MSVIAWSSRRSLIKYGPLSIITGTIIGACLLSLLLVFAGGEIGLACVGLCGLLVGLLLLPTHVRIGIPFTVLLLVPFDHILATAGEWLGWPVLMIGLALAIASAIRWQSFLIVPRDWDIHVLLLSKGVSAIANIGAGQIRTMLFWLAAGAIVIWLRAEEHGVGSVRNQIMLAIVIAGAVQGVVAILEALQIVDLPGLFASYEPNISELTGTFGIRSVGLAGDPLRLGTLTMLSGLGSFSRLTSAGHRKWRRGLYAAALLLSVTGLILSGARGSWLGFVVGACGMTAALLSKTRLRRAIWGLLAIVTIAAVVGTTDLGARIRERLWGSSVHPASVEQRLQAMEAVGMVWRQAPILGVGPGGMGDAVRSVGLSVVNIENEYFIALLGGGAVGLLALSTLVVRRSVLAWYQRKLPFGLETMGTVVALVVNLSTYNLLSWSAGASLLVAVCLPATSLLKRSSAIKTP